MTNSLEISNLAEQAFENSAGIPELDEFVYHISHDVRASSRALSQLPNWIEEDMADAGLDLPLSVQESLRLMQTHSTRLDRILYDLLIFSRIGRLQRTTDMEIAPQIAAVKHNLNIPDGFNVITKLGVATLRIGEKDIGRMFRALIDNAIKHHNKNAGLIRITTKKVDENVRITISDDGPGIEEQYQKRVLKMMTTLRPRDEVDGSGMGLPIVQKICETYGGTLEIQSPGPDGGCCVIINLPL